MARRALDRAARTPAARPTASELVAHLPALCTLSEAADYLRTSTRNLRRWMAIGRISAIRIVPGEGSSRVLIPRTAIEALLALSERL